MPRKRKTWMGRVHLGHQQYHWVGRYDTKKERDDAVAQARTDRPWETVPVVTGPTVDELAERFLTRMKTGAMLTNQRRRYKTSSVSTARTQLKALRADFGGRDPRTITRIEAEDWAAGVAPSKLPIVVQFFNTLLDADLVERNRFQGLGRRVETKKDRTPPTEAEMLLLLDACSVLDEYAPMMRSMLTFAAYTLLRPGELFALDWERDIDLQAGATGRATIRERVYRGERDLPKSNREKTVTLIPPAREALDGLLEIPGYYPAGPVFRNKTGGPLSAPTLTAYWKEVRARARVDVEFYVATKHFGVWYFKVRRGLDNGAIGAQAGWSEKTIDEMVATYGHAADERRLDDIDAAFRDDRDADRDASTV